MVQSLTSIQTCLIIKEINRSEILKMRKKETGEFVGYKTYNVNFATDVEKQTIHKRVDESKCIFSPSFRQNFLVG